MQFISDVFHWWYINESIMGECPNGLTIGMWSCGILGTISWLVGCLMGEWKTEGGVVGGLFIMALITMILCLVIALGGPIVVLFSIVIGFGCALEKIGDYWRNSVKNKEANRLTALAELINSDPQFKAQYEQLMKDTPKI